MDMPAKNQFLTRKFAYMSLTLFCDVFKGRILSHSLGLDHKLNLKGSYSQNGRPYFRLIQLSDHNEVYNYYIFPLTRRLEAPSEAYWWVRRTCLLYMLRLSIAGTRCRVNKKNDTTMDKSSLGQTPGVSERSSIAMFPKLFLPATPSKTMWKEDPTCATGTCPISTLVNYFIIFSVGLLQSRILVKSEGFSKTHYQGLRQFSLTVSWDLRT